VYDLGPMLHIIFKKILPPKKMENLWRF
jgi:hypothetical protein